MAGNPLNISIRVSGLDQAKADLQSFGTIGKKTFAELQKEARDLSKEAATTDQSLRGVANRVRSLAAEVDPAAASNLRLRNSLTDINRALRAGYISMEQSKQMTAMLRAENDKLANSTKGIVAEIRTLETIGTKSFESLTRSANNTARAFKPTEQSLNALAVQMRDLSRQADPLAAKNADLAASLVQVKAALDKNIISAEQYGKLKKFLRDESEKEARQAEASAAKEAAAIQAQAQRAAAAAQEQADKVAAAARSQAERVAAAAKVQADALNASIQGVKAHLQELAALSNSTFAGVQAHAGQRMGAGTAPVSGSQDQLDLATRIRALTEASDPLAAANKRLADSFIDVTVALQQELIELPQAEKLRLHLRQVSEAAAVAEAKAADAKARSIEEASARVQQAAKAESDAMVASTNKTIASIRELSAVAGMSFDQLEATAQNAASGMTPTAESTRNLAVRVQELAQAADPAAAAQQRLLRSLEDVNRALQSKIINTSEATQITKYLEEESLRAARAEAELENAVRNAAKVKVDALFQAANAQKASSQVAVAAITMEIKEMERLQKTSFTSGVAKNLPATGRSVALAPGSANEVALANQMRDLAAATNPLGAANKQYIETLRAVDLAVKQTIISEKQSADIKTHLRQELDKQVAALNKETAAHKSGSGARTDAATSVSKMNNALTQLSFQINDIGTSLASGASPLLVLAQQGGQIYQVFQMAPGGAGGVMKAFGDQLRGLASPMRAAGVGIAALGAAFLLVLDQAVKMQSKAREIDAVLQGWGDKSGATSKDFHDMELQLRAIGLSAEDAAAGLRKVVSVPGINQKQAARLVEAGADLGVLTGEGTDAATQRLTQMVSDKDLEQFIELGVAVGKFDENLVKLLRDMREANNLSGATDKAFDALSGHIKGTHASSVSDLSRAYTELKNAWKGFLEDSTVSSFFIEGMKVLKNTLNEVKMILELIDGLQKRFTRTGAEATALAQTARTDLDAAIVQRARESGEAVPAAGTARFDLAGLAANTEALQRLTAVAAEGSKILPEGFKVVATSTIGTRESGTRGHPEGRAMDLRIVSPSGPLPNQGPIGADPGWYKQLAIAMYEANKRLFGDAPITWGGRFETREGSGMLDWMHFAAEEDRGRFGPPLAVLAEQSRNAPAPAAALPPGTPATAAGGGTTAAGTAAGITAVRNQTDVLAKQSEERRKAIEIAQAEGMAQIALTARTQATTDATAKGYDGEVRRNFIESAVTQAIQLKIIELEKAGIIQDKVTAGIVESSTKATSQADALRLSAEATAKLRVEQGQANNVGDETRRILEQNAAAAYESGKQQLLATKPQIDALQRVAEAAKQGGAAQREAQVQAEAAASTQNALATAIASKNPKMVEEATLLHETAAAEIRRSDAATASTVSNVRDRETAANLATATSAKTLGEAYRGIATAQAEARVAGKQANDVATETNKILLEQATSALLTGRQTVLAAAPQIAHAEKIAEAARKGAGAQHEAEIAAAAAAKTQDVLTRAEETHNASLIEQAKLLDKTALAEEKRMDVAKQNLAIQQRMNQRTDQAALINQQTSMVGELPETIEAANAKLTEQQALLAAGKKLTDDIAKASLANVEALNKVNIAHAEATRQQERMNDMYRQIGSTIESAIGNVLDGIFNPKKAMDWGKTVRDMAKSLFTGITQNLFTKPLTGTILGALGAPATVTSQYGSFGGVGGMFGGGSSLLSELGMGGGSGSTGGMFSGVKDFFNSGLGGTFATRDTTNWIPGAGDIWTNKLTGATTDISGVSNITPGFFGNTTLGTAVGSVGLGFTAGTFLNSMVGGKSTGGMIGSGVGSLAGMALGSMVGMPWLGALLGGAGGGLLGGMFGNNKPSNASAGANIDLSQFKITSGFAGGNQQIDQQVAQMGQSLQGFMDLLKTTGGSLSGNVLLQSGVNTGITVDSSLEGYAGRFDLGKDTETATKTIEQALVKSITGVSETMKTVLSQVGTDEDIAAAIQFAKAYETLDEQSKTAFESIETGAKQMGPFEDAMVTIKQLFGEMTTQATRFGLALAPINEALAEATKRLQEDFLDAIQTASNVANSKTYRNTIADTIDAYLASTREASGIGLTDTATGDELGQLFMDQINELFSQLSVAEVQDVITTSFAGMLSALAPADVAAQLDILIDQLATTAISAGKTADALNDVTDAANRSKSAFDSIESLLNDLKVTPSATTSPEDALAASNAKFWELYNKASEGDLTALEGLTQASQDYIDNIQSYFASSPTGQDTMKIVTDGLQSLVDMFPTMTDPTKITNDLLASIDTSSTGTSGNTAALIGSTATLVASNNAAAQQAIQINDDNMANFNQSLADNAATNQANNDANTKTLTDMNAASSAELIAQAVVDRDALIAANNAATAQILADSALANDALITNNIGNAQAIVQQNQEAADATSAAILDSASDTIEANNAAADTLIAQNTAATTATIAANNLAKDAMIAASNEALAAQTTAAGLDADAMLTANAAAASSALANAMAAEAATLASNTAQTTAVVAANEAASDAGVAATTAATTAITAQTLAAQTATVDANNAASIAMVAASNTAKEATVAATTAQAAAIVADSKAQATAMIAANDAAADLMIASTDAITLETEATKNAMVAANTASADAIVAQATIAGQATVAATTASSTALVADNKTQTNALIAQNTTATASLVASSDKITAQTLASQNAMVTANNAASTAAIAQSNVAKDATVLATNTSSAAIIADSKAQATAQITANNAATASMVAGTDKNTTALANVFTNLLNSLISTVSSGTVSIVSSLTSLSNTTTTGLTNSSNAQIGAYTTLMNNLGTVVSTTGSGTTSMVSVLGVQLNTLLNSVITAVANGAATIANSNAAWFSSTYTLLVNTSNNEIVSNTGLINNLSTVVSATGTGTTNTVTNLGTLYTTLMNSLINTVSTGNVNNINTLVSYFNYLYTTVWDSTSYMAGLNTTFFNNLGATVFNTGTGTTNTVSAWASAQYTATWDTANSIIANMGFLVDSINKTIWDAMNLNVNTYFPTLFNINAAQWQVLDYQLQATYFIGNQIAGTQWDSISALVLNDNVLAGSIVDSVWGAASSVVFNGGVDASNLNQSILAAANSIIAAELVYSNNTLNSIAVYGDAIISNIQIYGNSTATAVYDIGNQIVQADANYTNSILNQLNGTTNSLINVDTANAQGIGTAVYGTSSQELYTYGVFANNQLYATNNASVTNSNWLNNIYTWVYNSYNLINYYGELHLQRFDTMITYLYNIDQRLLYPNPQRVYF